MHYTIFFYNRFINKTKSYTCYHSIAMKISKDNQYTYMQAYLRGAGKFTLTFNSISLLSTNEDVGKTNGVCMRLC